MLCSLMMSLETSEQEPLLETMKRYNWAANFLVEKAFELKLSNKFKLQKLQHNETKEKFKQRKNEVIPFQSGSSARIGLDVQIRVG